MSPFNPAHLLYGGAALATAALLLAAGCGTARPGVKQAAQPLLERGAGLYTANCQQCHGGATGGSMMDIPPPHNANGHTWHHPSCQLTDTILNGSGEMGAMMRQMMNTPETVPRMPAFRDKLTEQDAEAILAYIRTWWTEEQQQFQARATEEAC